MFSATCYHSDGFDRTSWVQSYFQEMAISATGYRNCDLPRNSIKPRVDCSTRQVRDVCWCHAISIYVCSLVVLGSNEPDTRTSNFKVSFDCHFFAGVPVYMTSAHSCTWVKNRDPELEPPLYIMINSSTRVLSLRPRFSAVTLGPARHASRLKQLTHGFNSKSTDMCSILLLCRTRATWGSARNLAK